MDKIPYQVQIGSWYLISSYYREDGNLSNTDKIPVDYRTLLN